MRRKVVVTGMGAISPLGNDVKSNWDKASKGISGIGKITKFDASNFATQIAGEVKNFEIGDLIQKKEIKKMDQFIHFTLSATDQALKDSGFIITESNAWDVGVSIGVGIGGLPNIEKYRDVVRDRGPRKITPFFIPMTISNMTSGQISIAYGAKGYNATTTSACSSSNHSIGDAARIIERGDAIAMIVGGAEAAICPLAIGGFGAMKALSTNNDNPEQASRPYDTNRDGFVLGEGSGILIIENYEHAKNRGAKIYAEVAGYGFSADAYHMTSPTLEGPAMAMKKALEDAQINFEDLNYINTHGTSTPAGDINELNAIKIVLGLDAAKKVSISSTKSMTGHLLGGAGAIEAIFTLKAMESNLIPPTINVDKLDPGCDLDITPNIAKEKNIPISMSNGFGFGGTNATLVFRKI